MKKKERDDKMKFGDVYGLKP